MEVLLAGGAEVESKDGKGQTPLVSATAAGQAKAVELLIDAGSDPNRATLSGHIPLYFAKELPVVVKVLLSRGASARFVDTTGHTVLHAAASVGYSVAVLCALFKGGTVIAIQQKCC